MTRRRPWVVAVGSLLAMGASPMSSLIPTVPSAVLRAVVEPAGPATLASAAAFADSLDTGIRLTRVRIVDALDLTITLRSDPGVILAEAPAICIAWVDAAPDDAGLESPCWGVPDSSTGLAEVMARSDGTWGLEPSQTVAVQVRMTRGGGRCDYPPGEWVLRVRAVPLVDGIAQEPVYIRTPFEVAYDPADVPTVLPLSQTLFCGVASEVLREQGAPPTPAP
jgi:hypothetical protein